MSLASCQKDSLPTGNNVVDQFFVDHKGSSMPVRVFGNIQSKTILIFISGGPGGTGMLYKTDEMAKIEKDYAVAYIDQRNSGVSQGSSSSTPLTIEQFAEDLDIVVESIKFRYGKDMGIFIIGQSFGGFPLSSYVTTSNYQKKLKGFIILDGATDDVVLNSEAHKMYLEFADRELAAKRNIEKWTAVRTWFTSNIPPFTRTQSITVNTLFDGEDMMKDSIRKLNKDNSLQRFLKLRNQFDIPMTAFGITLQHTISENSQIVKDMYNKQFHDKFSKVTIPAMFICGEYDFICPPGLHRDAYNKVSSTSKYLEILPNCGHSAFEEQPELFVKKLKFFMDTHK